MYTLLEEAVIAPVIVTEEGLVVFPIEILPAEVTVYKA